MSETGQVAPGAPRSRLRRLGRIVERTLAVVGALLIVYHLGFDLHQVVSASMSPLLRSTEGPEGPDWALVEKFSAGRVPARFQVVTFVSDEGLRIVKRVVALPGETIAIASHQLVVNGERLPTPAGVGRGKGYLAAGNLHDGVTYRVPEGHVYLLGDDQQDSEDSRFSGPLSVARIRGRVFLRCWPLARMKWLL